MASPKPVPALPETLSHYTSLEGLQGIIKSRRLWASNASFLNDKAELEHALAAAKLAIQRMSSKRSMEVWKPLLKRVINEFENGGIPDTYVACFCRSADNLSQWRGYSGGTQGVSLTFDRAQLSERLKKDGAILLKVRYTKLSTVEKLTDALAGELRSIASLEEVVGSSSTDVRIKDLRRRVSALLPRFKHLGFMDEKEWRYVIQRDVPKNKLCFRVSLNKVVPYIEIGTSPKLLPLVGVRVGPGPDQELTMRSLRLFLLAQGYNVPVSASEVPFRV